MAAIELGVPYFLYNPAQSNYFALNAPADTQFVGYVDDTTGLDDAGVRENAQVVVAGDGGYHGSFWKDRRPWTMSGLIIPQFPLLSRDQAQEKIQGIMSQCLKSDGYLTWTPADGIQKMIRFRKQQPSRMTSGQSKVDKRFAIAGVAADWRVLSWTQHNVTGTSATSPLILPTATNLGNADASPKFAISVNAAGALRTVAFTNNTTSKTLTLNNFICDGSTWTVDLTGLYPQVLDATLNNRDYTVDPLNTDWSIAVAGVYDVAGGNNTFQVAVSGGTFTSLTCTMYWNYSWV